MNYEFDLYNILNQYTLYAIPFLVLIGGALLSRFVIGGSR